MKIKLVGAAAGGLVLLGAAPPPQTAPAPAAPVSKSGYPPCSRTDTDRCIQLYERGVGSEANLARNAKAGPGVTATAQAAPARAAAPVRLASRSTHKPRRTVRRAGERG